MSSIKLSNGFNPSKKTFIDLSNSTQFDSSNTYKAKENSVIDSQPWEIYDEVGLGRERRSLHVMHGPFRILPLTTIIQLNSQDRGDSFIREYSQSFDGGIHFINSALRMLGTPDNLMLLALISPPDCVYNTSMVINVNVVDSWLKKAASDLGVDFVEPISAVSATSSGMVTKLLHYSKYQQSK